MNKENGLHRLLILSWDSQIYKEIIEQAGLPGLPKRAMNESELTIDLCQVGDLL